MKNMDNQSHGIWRIIPSMALTEMIAQSGFDFQIFDCEHGVYDYQTLEHDVRVCQLHNCLAYIRVSGLNKVEIQRYLDIGADGIVFPQLNKLEDFKLATKLIQYPPKGVRGFNPFVRAGDYGMKEISKKIECIAIIETLQAVNDFDKILLIDDINTIYIGVYDLSAQLNCIGLMDSPKLISVIDLIIEKSINSSKKVSLMVNNMEDYVKYKDKGVFVFVHSVDSFQLKKKFLSIINDLKGNK